MSRSEPVARRTGTTADSFGDPPSAVPVPGPAERLFGCADLLACPECGQDLTGRDRTLRCPRGHSFDLAKQGYVSLLTGASTKMTGDTPAMLDARAAFQQSGHFAPIAAALARATAAAIPTHTRGETGKASERLAASTAEPAERAAARSERSGDSADSTAERPEHADDSSAAAAGPSGAPRAGSRPADSALTHPGSAVLSASATRLTATLLAAAHAVAPDRDHRSEGAPAILEIGAGTGYYLAAALDATPTARGIALDVSKPAARRSARAHPRAAAVLADAWHGLPVRDGVLSAVLSVFAPRNADEVARVLAPGGRFIIATPTPRHLGELIEPLDMVRVDAAKDNRLAESLGERFELLERARVEYPMSLTRADIANVAGMGPSAFHATADRAERIAALPEPVAVTASVSVTVYRPRA